MLQHIVPDEELIGSENQGLCVWQAAKTYYFVPNRLRCRQRSRCTNRWRTGRWRTYVGVIFGPAKASAC
jgi:hypothetical protein